MQTSSFLRLLDLAGAEPSRPYARFGEREILLGDLDRSSAAIAHRLLAFGLRAGDRVAVMLANGPLTVALIFGIARAGMVWVPVNTRQQGDSLTHVLRHSAPSLLLVDAGLEDQVLAALAAEAGPDLPVFPVLGDAMPALPEHLAVTALPPGPGDGQVFAIMYTSGTSGRPKGVQVTHRMFEYAARAALILAEIRDDDVMFVWEPLIHIGGAQLLVLPLYAATSLHFVPRFSASRFWDEVRESGATHIHYLGGVLQILLRNPPSARDRSHAVRVAWGGGCPAEDWEAFENRFGVDVREAYGMTEVSSFTTANVGGPVGSVGKPLPWLRVEILDDKGHALPAGERGEIVVSQLEDGVLTPGYLDNPEATAAGLRNGRFHTGDGGTLDAEGWLTFHGRLNDSVRRRGENISAWEVESVALKHPAVLEVAMVGVKAEIGEQEIKLFIRPAKGASIAAADLHDWLRGQLGGYRTPRYIAFVDDFPKTPSERIRKGLLSQATDDCWDADSARAPASAGR